jgi:hypothetical protein
MDVSNSMDNMANFVRNFSQIDYPLNFPANFLLRERNYVFKVAVCNFVGLCSVGARSVYIVYIESPVAYITGVDPLVIKSSEALVVKAMTPKVNLNDSSPIPSQTYSWTMFENGQIKIDFASASNIPFWFKLSPYSLTAGRLYSLRLVVYDKVSDYTTT